MLVGAPAAHRELDRMGLAEDDHPLGDQPPRQRRRHRRAAVAPYHRAAGRHPPFEVDQILQRDRHAMQRPDRVARADRLVGRLGGEPSIVAVNIDKRVQFGIVRGDACQQRLDDCDRRQPARRDLGGEAVSGQKARIGIGGGHGKSTKRECGRGRCASFEASASRAPQQPGAARLGHDPPLVARHSAPRDI